MLNIFHYHIYISASTHIHAHTDIYIYIYIYTIPEAKWEINEINKVDLHLALNPDDLIDKVMKMSSESGGWLQEL